jgi:predicted DNA-binding protein (MmcQ/YjbR family)
MGRAVLDSVTAALDAKPGVTSATAPGAPGVTMYKVLGKIFAILEDRRITAVILKCDPALVDILKQQYDGVGHRSHLDRRFWICVDLDGDVPLKEIKKLAAQSYDLVCAKLTRKQRAELEVSGA